MIFLDASVIIAIIAGEDDAEIHIRSIDQANVVHVSPISIYESVAGLARKRACSVEEAEELVDIFLLETQATVLPIDDAVGRHALQAFRRYGRPGHKAKLNMGDCFAYACTRVHGLRLLFKGNDFGHTDIEQV